MEPFLEGLVGDFLSFALGSRHLVDGGLVMNGKCIPFMYTIAVICHEYRMLICSRLLNCEPECRLAGGFTVAKAVVLHGHLLGIVDRSRHEQAS